MAEGRRLGERMRIVKVIGGVLLGLVVLVVIGVTVLAFYHRQQLREEAEEYPPPGRIVDVDGQGLHVYAEGDGEQTLVFMAGHGTSCPSLDFKPLWSRVVDEYRIVVVEKVGYGWSETSGSPRDLDTILDETRQALDSAGETGPFVLVPHSMSGLEAVYWAQKYPEEVVAIIGLDPLTPAAVAALPEPSMAELNVTHFVSRIGLSRLMPEEDLGTVIPLLALDELDDAERRQYVAVFFRSAVTTPMLDEVRHLNTNAQLVAEREVPAGTPTYFFTSSEQEAVAPGWLDALTGYLGQAKTGRHLHLETGHYVHYEEADVIAGEIKAFLRDID